MKSGKPICINYWRAKADRPDGCSPAIVRCRVDCPVYESNSKPAEKENNDLRRELNKTIIMGLEQSRTIHALRKERDELKRRVEALKEERTKIRPLAMAYEHVCQMIGIENDIVGHVRRRRARYESLKQRLTSREVLNAADIEMRRWDEHPITGRDPEPESPSCVEYSMARRQALLEILTAALTAATEGGEVTRD